MHHSRRTHTRNPGTTCFPEVSLTCCLWLKDKWDLLQGYSFRTAALSGSLNRAGLNGLRSGSAGEQHGLIIDDDSAYEDAGYVSWVEGETHDARMSRIEGMVGAMVDAYSQGVSIRRNHHSLIEQGHVSDRLLVGFRCWPGLTIPQSRG